MQEFFLKIWRRRSQMRSISVHQTPRELCVLPHQNARLFSALRMRDVQFRNRIAVPQPCQYSSGGGFANDWHLVHLDSESRVRCLGCNWRTRRGFQ